MANPEHIKWLEEGVEAWNARRETNDFLPDLRGANLREANLRMADLREANLWRADLRMADLQEANLRMADLQGADLEGADLRGADLQEADLRGADLRMADLQEANVTSLVYSGSGTNDLSDPEVTDLSTTLNLTQNQLDQMQGDSGTLLPERLTRPAHWPDLDAESEEGQRPAPQPSLDTPIVRASAYDLVISDDGVEAITPDGRQISRAGFGPNCLNKMDALIANAQTIAGAVSNKLGEDLRADLLAYADHLETSETGNPHRLSFLAKGIAADLNDPLVSGGFSNRLRDQLTDFLEQHHSFLAECLPEAAKAERIKDEAQLTRAVTKQEATDILNRLEEAIAVAEAATDSSRAAIADFRAFDDELNAFLIKVYSPEDQAKLDAAIKQETVELASFGARLFWRAKQVIAQVRLHAGDLAIAGTLSGKTAPQMAQAIVNRLEPLMHKLGELLTALPPIV